MGVPASCSGNGHRDSSSDGATARLPLAVGAVKEAPGVPSPLWRRDRTREETDGALSRLQVSSVAGGQTLGQVWRGVGHTGLGPSSRGTGWPLEGTTKGGGGDLIIGGTI